MRPQRPAPAGGARGLVGQGWLAFACQHKAHVHGGVESGYFSQRLQVDMCATASEFGKQVGVHYTHCGHG